MLKTDPKYGVYPWWPENGNDWIHPEDVATTRNMIPSWRVFRRDGQADKYIVLHYGDIQLRILPTLWIEIDFEGLDMGDWVEVKSRGRRNTPRIGPICEMLFNPWSKRLEYQILDKHLPIETHYHVEDLQPIEPIQPIEWSTEISHPT